MIPSEGGTVGSSNPVASNDRSASERELAEITRSAGEARKFVFTGVKPSEVERYLDPPTSTPYSLEHAFHLLGDIRSKTAVDLGCGKDQNIVPLAKRGADVTGIDISPELIQRLDDSYLPGA